MGQCSLVKPECVKVRHAEGEQEPEKVTAPCALSHLVSVAPPLYERKEASKKTLPRKFITL